MNGVVETPLSGEPLRCRSESPRSSKEPAALETFVAGPENRLAYVAVRSVLDDSEDAYSPLVFYGPPGTGKSHLALGLATAWKARFRKRPAVCVTATDFARELADAIQTKTADDFGVRYRGLSLLVFEDLGHLAGKGAAQQELIFTLDALADIGGRVMLTASSPPSEVAGMMPGLRSRLAAGLAVPLVRPGREARLTILRRIAQSRGVALPDSVVELLADALRVTVPELVGALIELEFSAGMDHRAIDVPGVRRYLAKRNGAKGLSIHEIALSTARHFSLKLADLRSPSRRRAVVTARGVAIYLARNLTNQSLEEIGEYFAGRDHTTVSYGYRKTEERLETESEVRDAVLAIRKRFESGPSPRQH
ncbi:MAG: ATP-binding protein [Planctomycetes bacterium]|nr:ATP-binding protein [Planctomycetota bacterium]